MPSEIIIFEPTAYLDAFYLTKRKKSKYKHELNLAHKPVSYREIGKVYAEKWRKQGLDVTFWTEEDILRARAP